MPLNPSQVLGSKDVCKEYCVKRLVRDQDPQKKTWKEAVSASENGNGE
jgi:hypothetical protein